MCGYTMYDTREHVWVYMGEMLCIQGNINYIQGGAGLWGGHNNCQTKALVGTIFSQSV